VLKLILFVLPLGLDTFAVSAALGLGGLPARKRLHVSLVLSLFEMGMPLVGLVLGQGLGYLIGDAADYLAIVILAFVGIWILVQEDDDEGGIVAKLAGGRVLVLIALGFSISLDELAMGFAIGLLHLPVVPAVVLIGAQAFVFAQLGLRVGARLNQTLRERADQLAGAALLALAILLAVEKVA